MTDFLKPPNLIPGHPRVDFGSFSLESPFLLAPLAGLTNWPFRRLAKEEGAGLTVTEMVSATAQSFKGKATLKLLDTDPAVERPFCVQLFGKDPDRLALAAREAAARGADIIDLNLGCPARKVVNSGHGSALLKDFPLIKKLARALVRAVSRPITVKTRLGFSPGEGSVFDLLPLLADEGVAAVTVHPRYASQGFSGRADWEALARLAERSPLPLIGSGDIQSPAEALDRLRNYGVRAVMIGRAAKGRPWLFRQCLDLARGAEPMEPDLPERWRIAVRHARLMSESFGGKAPFMLRTVLMWYTKGLHGSAEFRARICREEETETQLALLEECVRANISPAENEPRLLLA